MSTLSKSRRVPRIRRALRAAAPPPETAAWEGCIGTEGEMTGDGRIIQPGALRWDRLPIPLRYVSSDVGAHDGAQVVGHIYTIERRDTDDPGVKEIWATGDFDLDSPVGLEAARQVGKKLTNGVSMDLDDVTFEVEGGDGEMLPDGMLAEDQVMSTVDARVRASTIVAIPAFANAYISMIGPNDSIEDNPDIIPGSDAFRDVGEGERKNLAEKGMAMPDGSYPIANCEDLKNAIQAIGRASDPAAVKAHIASAKSSLGCDEVELPDTWARRNPFADRASMAARVETFAFNPDQWRVPGGNGRLSGRWLDMPNLGALLGRLDESKSPDTEGRLQRAQGHLDTAQSARDRGDFTGAQGAFGDASSELADAGRAEATGPFADDVNRAAQQLEIAGNIDWSDNAAGPGDSLDQIIADSLGLEPEDISQADLSAPAQGRPVPRLNPDTDEIEYVQPETSPDLAGPDWLGEESPAQATARDLFDSGAPGTQSQQAIQAVNSFHGTDFKSLNEALGTMNDEDADPEIRKAGAEALLLSGVSSVQEYEDNIRAIDSGGQTDASPEAVDESDAETEADDLGLPAPLGEDDETQGIVPDDTFPSAEGEDVSDLPVADDVPDLSGGERTSEAALDGLTMAERRAVKNEVAEAAGWRAGTGEDTGFWYPDQIGDPYDPNGLLITENNSGGYDLLSRDHSIDETYDSLEAALAAADAKPKTELSEPFEVESLDEAWGDYDTGLDGLGGFDEVLDRFRDAEDFDVIEENLTDVEGFYSTARQAMERGDVNAATNALYDLAANLERLAQGADNLDDLELSSVFDAMLDRVNGFIEDIAPEFAGGTDTLNWVDDVGGLPLYIKRISDALQRRGMTESHAIASAVNTVKRWARGGGDVKADTRAKAAAAVAEWEAKKAAARATAARTILAAAAPVAPPQAWFFRAEANGPTPITVTEDGEVYGHLATYDQCHIASPSGPGVCVIAPHSNSGYAHFHTGAVRTAEGTTVGVGRITLNTGHAGPRDSALKAMSHYDNTGSAVADVHAIDGVYGIWISGALRPGVNESTKRTLRASPLSGDWRMIGGSMELVAALAVNVPGFPVPRPLGLVASASPDDIDVPGELVSLVAAGMLAPRRVRLRTRKPDGTPKDVLSDSDLRYLKSLAERERAREREELAVRVANSKRVLQNRQNRAKVEAFAARMTTTKKEG